MKKLNIFLTAAVLVTLILSACSSAKMQREVKPDDPKYKITFTRSGDLMGEAVLATFPDIAPKHAANFDKLVKENFYDGILVHRIIPGFMIQAGCPNTKNKPDDIASWGYGDPSQERIAAEFSDLSHVRGTVSAARKGGDINSATSQFFIMLADNDELDGQYSIFGRVISGMETIDKISNVELREHPATKAKEVPVDNIVMKIERIN